MNLDNLNLSTIETPCFIINYLELIENLQLAKSRADELNIKILLSVKGFPLAKIYDDISEYLSGVSAASLFEAKLGKHMGKEVHIHAVAYKDNQIEEIFQNADHIVFNSIYQLNRFKSKLSATPHNISFGIRFNPEYSEINVEKYNTCSQFSRFGITTNEFNKLSMADIEGVHLHAMNENDANTFRKIIYKTINEIGDRLHDLKWINFGGGQLITDKEYDISLLKEPIALLKEQFGLTVYIEPCESLVTKSGYLIASVLDIVHNGKDIAILDTSAICHMPDVISMPYTPDISYPKTTDKGYKYVLAGNTCLVGDIIGEYSFNNPLKIGDKIIFEEMGAYTFSQESYFNGINHPDILLYKNEGDFKIIKHFDYKDYKHVYY